MTLSRRERHVLAGLERTLAGDPILAELAAMFAAPAPAAARRRRIPLPRIPLARIPLLAAVLAVLVGVSCAVGTGLAGLWAVAALGIALAAGSAVGVVAAVRTRAVPAGDTPKPIAR